MNVGWLNTDSTSEDDEVVLPARPGSFRTIVFMVAGFPLRLVEFVLAVVFLSVGFGTVIIWVGFPLLVAGLAMVRAFGNVERAWTRKLLGADLPRVRRPPVTGDGMLSRLLVRLTDAATWREFGYLMLSLPIACFELAMGLVSIVLFPFALWVAPWLGALHAALARWMLGPDRLRSLEVRAERLQASRARGVDAAEAERRRIERDLHDGAQQRLVAIAMTLGRAKSKLAGTSHGVRELIEEAHTDAKLAVSELRDLARGIYPAVLSDRGLDAALSALAARAPYQIDVKADIAPRPPAAVETTAYFIVGEALTNAAKHANASHATVKVWREEEKVVVEVTDNGEGGAVVRPGGGLAGLADRAAMIDGVIAVISPVGGPTVVRAELPCEW